MEAIALKSMNAQPTKQQLVRRFFESGWRRAEVRQCGTKSLDVTYYCYARFLIAAGEDPKVAFPFAASECASAKRRAARGGQNIEGRCAGGARGMRELLWTLQGRHLAAICEFTNFEASRIRARLAELHRRWCAHAEEVRGFLKKVMGAA